jgi:hypothetical protein
MKMLLSAITGAASGISTITTAVAGVRGVLGLYRASVARRK